MITRTPLDAGWQLDLAPGGEGRALVPRHILEALPIPATVPGTVHTDLLAAGLIPDPYLDSNELALDWIGRVDWSYHTTLPADPDAREVLEFDGLDTLATALVDGVEVAVTRNQHRRYTVDVAEGSDRERTLEIRFASAVRHGEAERSRLGELPNAYPAPFNYLRKMACNFGWDWGPTLVTAGIWREARSIRGAGVRLHRVAPRVAVRGGSATVSVEVELAGDTEAPLRMRAEVAGVTAEVEVPAGGDRASVELIVEAPPLWWPRGLGDQPLSELRVTIADETGVADTWSQRIGFRSVELDTSEDEVGSAFAFVINGAVVPVRGANWIPDDCFLPRVTPERLRRRLTQAADAGVNLLRVWGGGVYESDTFYALCDELGIMVWQDFLFACAAYPESPELVAEVDAEARDNVHRLLPHPSLVLWNGNNENIWGWFDWDWQGRIGDRDWGLGYYLDVLPSAVRETDPDRPYWAGSPYSGTMDIHPNADEHGLKHIWDVWNEVDYTVYRSYRPRFASEFGWQGPANHATIAESIHDRPLSPTSPGMLHHQKANDGNGKLERGLAPHLDIPEDFDDWHYAMQLNQARAVAFGIEHFRSLRPRCLGTIVWQLNDCWPVTSWAAIDGYGRKKLLWFALRSAYAERLLTVQPAADGSLALVGVNDGAGPWREPVTVRRIDLDGTVLAEFRSRLAADRLGAATIALPAEVGTPCDPTSEVIVAQTAGGVRALHFFAEDRDIAYRADGLTARAERRSDGAVVLELSATTVVRDIVIAADRVHPDAEAADALVTLLPGETARVLIGGVPEGEEQCLLSAPVLRSVNDLAGAGAPA